MEITTSKNGAAVNGAPLTTTLTREVVPGLLRNAIDDRIVKIRPMATPIDQLTRCAGARPCNAMKVDYYSVDVKAVSTTVKEAFDPSDTVVEDMTEVTIKLNTADNKIFSPTETVLLPGITVRQPDADGTEREYPLTFYVLEVDRNAGLTLSWINPTFTETDMGMVPSFGVIPAGATIVRMGRAATELDVQTSQFEALPVKKNNNCQIFKMQVEQSTFQKLANKEVGWNFTDQEEVAVIDMRQGMEKNFLFGRQGIFVDPVKHEEVYLTGGIWNQTDKTFTYNGAFDAATVVDLCRRAFTGTGGSTRKILIGGSGLVEALSKMEYTKNVEAAGSFVKWGIQFKEIASNFGSLYLLHSEIFDQCGHADDGFILDPDYLTKYCHVPFHTETLDLRRTGQRNSDAIVITEASCLVLRHPDSHMRVVCKK